MEDEGHADSPGSEEPAGVLGDGALHAGKGNMALVRRAIRERWPISDEIRQSVVKQMARIITSGDGDDRNKVAASKVLIAADAINAKREATETPQEHHHSHLHASVSDLRRQMLDDPEYLEFCRGRGGDDAPKSIPKIGSNGASANGHATNGHHSGNGHSGGLRPNGQ